MAKASRIYRMSPSGRRAWEKEDATVTVAFRRILGMLDADAHIDVVRGYLRRYPDQLILEWLAELEELGLVESRPDKAAHDLDFTGSFKVPNLIAEDKAQLAKESQAADGVLARKGVYLAAERLKNRRASEKAPAETIVLIVEDDPDQLALAQLRVRMAGFAARTADSAAALQSVLEKHEPPDVVLLDIMLPDGDGFDILAGLRGHPKHALLPVVMLTVKDDPMDVQRGLALGADGYIVKPYSKKLLEDLLSQVLRLDAG
ncbi:MAG: response regulator transcription factor [Burkholderiales bacterium]